jgi:hypothetical protein
VDHLSICSNANLSWVVVVVVGVVVVGSSDGCYIFILIVKQIIHQYVFNKLVP